MIDLDVVKLRAIFIKLPKKPFFSYFSLTLHVQWKITEGYKVSQRIEDDFGSLVGFFFGVRVMSDERLA